MWTADIAVAVSTVSAFCEKPHPSHWQHVKRIFRYLRGTTHYGIVLGSVNKDKTITITAFSDSSYAEQEGAKSRLGMLIMLNGGLLKAKTKKSNHVAFYRQCKLNTLQWLNVRKIFHM